MPLRDEWFEDPRRQVYVSQLTGLAVTATQMAQMNPKPWQSQQWYSSGVTNVSGPVYAPQATWHNFPCGHQVKLEPGQPPPGRCATCPPPERVNHEYKPCGHVYGHEKGATIPAECPTCEHKRVAEANERQAALEAAEADRLAREEADKDPVAWLDRELHDVVTDALAGVRS